MQIAKKINASFFCLATKKLTFFYSSFYKKKITVNLTQQLNTLDSEVVNFY